MKINSIGVITYSDDPLMYKTLDIIKAWAVSQDIKVLVSEDLKVEHEDPYVLCDTDKIRTSDIIISIGGDGTFLSAARIVAGLETPILGINLGTIGFLTDYPITQIEFALKELEKEEINTSPRIMLDLEIRSQDNSSYTHSALNDVLIKPRKATQLVQLNVSVSQESLTTYKADSLIISSPTGSTAYNLAAGGPILYPTTEAFILNPINPSSLTVRPIVIPASEVIEIYSAQHMDLEVIIDGREVIEIHPNDTVIIKKAPWFTHFIKSDRYGFTEALKDKLGWSGLPYHPKDKS